MRVTIPIALLGAALLSGAALGQGVAVGSVEAQNVPARTVAERRASVGSVQTQSAPTLTPLVEPGLTAYAMAKQALSITHVSPASVEEGTVPAGLLFSDTPAGPACPHWPAYGCGVKYEFVKASHGYAYTYKGRDLVQVRPYEVGQAADNDNVIVALSSKEIPAFVDVKIKSIVDAGFSYSVAEVAVPGYDAIRHQFAPGYAETDVSLPVELSAWPLPIHVRTVVFVNNTLEPDDMALVDLDVQVTVRLPSASYTIEGATTCAGSNGTPFLSPPWGLPVLGSSFSIVAMNLPIDPAKPAYGLIGPRRFLPFSLESIGMPGCFLHVSSPMAIPLAKCCGTAEWTLPIPVNMELLGAEFYQQVFALDESWVNPLGCVITDVGHGVVGVPPPVN